MKVKDFIKWLETQDQEAIVEMIIHKEGDYYTQGGTVDFAEFDPEKDHFEYLGWGRAHLLIGCSDDY